MALGTQAATIGGASKNIVVGVDASGNIAAAHVTVGADGLEKGTPSNPLLVQQTGTLSVSGAFFPATQPVSLTALPALATGSNTVGGVTQSGTWTVALSGGNTTAIKVDASATTQPVSAPGLGAPGDAAWSSGSGSLIALSKAIVAAQQATTAAVTGSSIIPPSPTFAQTSALAASLVLKGGPGSLYACYVTTGSTAGWLMLFNTTSAPANGTVAPQDCIYCPANATTEIELPFLTPEPFSTGITAAFSSTGPFALTASSTAFIKGIVQ